MAPNYDLGLLLSDNEAGNSRRMSASVMYAKGSAMSSMSQPKHSTL